MRPVTDATRTDRTIFSPACTLLPSAATGSARGNRSGGLPYRIQPRNMPACRVTRVPLQMVAQLRLADLGVQIGELEYAWILAALDAQPTESPLFYRVSPNQLALRTISQPDGTRWSRTPVILPEWGLELAAPDPEAVEAPMHQLGGEPFWLTDEMSPKCAECQRAMTFFGQFDTDDRLGWRFGDVGMLYAFVCAPCAVFATLTQEP